MTTTQLSLRMFLFKICDRCENAFLIMIHAKIFNVARLLSNKPEGRSVLSVIDEDVKKIEEALLQFDTEAAVVQVKEALKPGMNPRAIIDVLSGGLRKIGDMFSRNEIFLPELIMAGEAMKAVMEILTPLVPKGETSTLGKIVLGTVQNDIHDLGKRIVGAFLQANGFEVVDLGVDVPAEIFVGKVRELKPDILGMSALLTTTMGEMGKVIEKVKEAGLRGNVKIIIGGAPTSETFATGIGADAWGADASDACLKSRKLLKIEM